MAKRFYTILILPDATRSPTKLHLSRWAMITIGLGLSAVFLCVLAFVLQYIGMSANMLELKRLRGEVADYRALGDRLQGVQKEVSRLQDFDRKIRLLAQLPSGSGETSMPLGGGGELESESLARSMKLEKEQLMAKMEKEIALLEGAAKRQEARFSELKVFLENKKDRLSSTPSIWPVRGWVTAGFGYRRSPFTGARQLHEGLDIAISAGTPVIAPGDGTVVFSGSMPGWGNVVVINHGYGYRTFFAHHSRNLVTPGRKVKRGETIALVGSTGHSTGPHLHYEVLVNGVPRDPLNYMID
ncbi:MAG: M23 family metallopeptidase [candidate division NC10 bacterium]|nr:M23 family metallopeptidase [candidate division NC10 bacterium]